MRRLELNGCWKLGREKGKPLDAEVPGSVLKTLIQEGIIPDPFYGENEKDITPLFEQDFEYFRSFFVPAGLLNEDAVELVCLGIDTLGEIYINGALIAAVDNMHRSWRFDIKKRLVCGENSIRVVLRSPSRYVTKAYNEGPVKYVNLGNMPGSGYLRKAHSQFGWDWGPVLPDAGIWRDIYIEGWSTARLEDLRIRQEHDPAGPVTVKAKVRPLMADLRGFWAKGKKLRIVIALAGPGGGVLKEQTVTEEPGDAEISLLVTKPELWYPRGLGKQNLYGITAELFDGDLCLDRLEQRIGLRTMTVSAGEDRWGREFTLTVNGIKFFSMGADYIPQDSVISLVSPERTRRLLEDCVRANFNTIRVWGGGYYPGDFFYDICDELGLVVWQDLMFACNIYVFTEEFAASVEAEVRENMARIRHHACLGLWCGNNEMELAWNEWDNVKHHPAGLRADYIRLFETLLPKIARETDPDTFYWPASPSSGGGFDDPNAPDRGDVHYWEVWHGLKPFSEYRKYLFRYCSEFGFESLPDLETIKTFAPPEELNLFSPVMEAHQRCPGGNGKILYYIAETYRYPKDFASLVYISQVLQMESIQYGVDHWRRNRGRCMGAVYWQLNDCWPVCSWSGIDYYGRWKALHYGARRFFAPVRATVFFEEGTQLLRVFAHNESPTAEKCTLRVFLCRRDFTVLAEEELKIEIPPFSAREVFAADYASFVRTKEAERSVFACAELRSGGACTEGRPRAGLDGKSLLSRETALFVPPKHFLFQKPRYTAQVTGEEDAFVLEIKADTYCRFVRIRIKDEDPVLSDNYFDLTGCGGTAVLVEKKELKQSYTAESLKAALELFSAGETYDV